MHLARPSLTSFRGVRQRSLERFEDPRPLAFVAPGRFGSSCGFHQVAYRPQITHPQDGAGAQDCATAAARVAVRQVLPVEGGFAWWECERTPRADGVMPEESS